MNPDALDAACELWDEMIRRGGILRQRDAVAHLAATFGGGGGFVAGGRIDATVIEHFRRVTGNLVVWSMTTRGWRYRTVADPPPPVRRVP